MKHSNIPKENLVSTRKQLKTKMEKIQKAVREFEKAHCKLLDAQMDFATASKRMIKILREFSSK